MRMRSLSLLFLKVFLFRPLSLPIRRGRAILAKARLQEALAKIPLPSDCRWHFIGTLQSNKAAKAVSSFQLIHSVDTPALARKISQAGEARGFGTSILLQVNTSGEASKHGLSDEGWEAALPEMNQLPFLKIEGLMTMAPLTEDQTVIRTCFRNLRELRDQWRTQRGPRRL